MERELLDKALNSQYGIEVQCNNATSLRGKLYRFIRDMKKLGIDKYNRIKFKLSPVNQTTHLWIINNDLTQKQKNPSKKAD